MGAQNANPALTAEILSLIAEEKELFLQIEQATEAMCTAPVEEIEPLFDKRQQCFERVVGLRERLGALSGQGGREVEEALHNRCKRLGLSPELAAIYDAAMGVKAVASRIQQYDPLVESHIKSLQSEIMAKIEKINQSGASVAGQYSRLMGIGGLAPSPLQGGRKI